MLMMFLLTNHRSNEAESLLTSLCLLHQHSWHLVQMPWHVWGEAVSGQLPAVLSQEHTAEPLQGALKREGRKEVGGGWGLTPTPAPRF